MSKIFVAIPKDGWKVPDRSGPKQKRERRKKTRSARIAVVLREWQ
jgi:hypothetical protein